jgi:hypothetical protein
MVAGHFVESLRSKNKWLNTSSKVTTVPMVFWRATYEYKAPLGVSLGSVRLGSVKLC